MIVSLKCRASSSKWDQPSWPSVRDFVSIKSSPSISEYQLLVKLRAGAASFVLFISFCLRFVLVVLLRLLLPASLPGVRIHRCSVGKQWREEEARKRRAGCPPPPLASLACFRGISICSVLLRGSEARVLLGRRGVVTFVPSGVGRRFRVVKVSPISAGERSNY